MKPILQYILVVSLISGAASASDHQTTARVEPLKPYFPIKLAPWAQETLLDLNETSKKEDAILADSRSIERGIACVEDKRDSTFRAAAKRFCEESQALARCEQHMQEAEYQQASQTLLRDFSILKTNLQS